jgi:hypothetical protein
MMIPILQYPDIDGNRYSRTSVDVSVDNKLRLLGWTKLSVKRTLTKGKGWASRSKPQVRTRGKFDPKMTLGLYQEDYNLLLTYLTAKGALTGKGAFEVSFLLTATIFEITLGTTIWEGIGCQIEDESLEQGGSTDEPPEVSLDLNIMDCLKDGISVVLENTPYGQAGAP